MAYSSKLDLRIGEVPNVTDPEIFPDLMDIYNAIHILGQYVNSVIKGTNPDDNEDTSRQLPFQYAFWVRAAVNIKEGDIIHVDAAGAYKGISHMAPPTSNPGPISNQTTISISAGTLSTVWGMALSDAVAGERVRLAIGPAILAMDDLNRGDKIFGASGFDKRWAPNALAHNPATRLSNDGAIYKNITTSTGQSPATSRRWARSYIQIGYAIEDGAAFLLHPGTQLFSTAVRDIEWA